MNIINLLNNLITSNKDSLPIWISILSLGLTIGHIIYTCFKNRINLSTEIKKLYLLNSNKVFIEFTITNKSIKQVVIQGIQLHINSETGYIYDKAELFISEKNPDSSIVNTYIHELPKQIPPLSAQRFWVRFDFDNSIILSKNIKYAKVTFICFDRKKSQRVALPSPLTEDELLGIN